MRTDRDIISRRSCKRAKAEIFTGHNAFTLTEILIVCMIMSTLVFMSFGINIATQTGKLEAERLATKLYRAKQTADRISRNFTLQILDDGEKIRLISRNHTDEIIANTGCRFELMGAGTNPEYVIRHSRFVPGGTIKVTGSDGSIYYVILSLEGRVRINDKPPE